MKTIINKIFLASALTLSLSACSDFLEKEPLSQGTEAIVFKTPEHFVQAANALYNMEGWKNYDNKANMQERFLRENETLLSRYAWMGINRNKSLFDM